MIDDRAAEPDADSVASQYRRDRARVLGSLVGAALLVVGLLLPWSYDDGYAQDAFARVWLLPVLALLTVAVVAIGGAALLTARQPVVRDRFGDLATGAAALALVCAGIVLANSGNHGKYSDWKFGWPGPALFGAGAVLICVESQRADRGSTRRPMPRRTAVIATVVIGGFSLAVAGLLAPWQNLNGDVIAAITDHSSLSWSGLEITDTIALRWAVVVAAVVLLAVAAIARLHVLLGPACLVGGVVIGALALTATGSLSVDGLGSSLGVGPGAFVTAAGGFVLVVAGVALVLDGRPDRRRATALAAIATLVAALCVPTAAPQSVRAATPARGPVLLGNNGNNGDNGDNERLGGPSATAPFSTASNSLGLSTSSRLRTPLIAGTDSRLWFLHEVDGDSSYRRTYVVEQIVDGHALPTTVIDATSTPTLVEVVGTTAVLAMSSSNTHWIALVNLTVPEVNPQPDVTEPDDGVRTVLTDNAVAGSAVAGRTAGRVRVAAAADGSVLIQLRSEQNINRYYRFDRKTIEAGTPWLVDRTSAVAGTPTAADTVPGVAGATYTYDSGQVIRVPDDGTLTTVALGNVSDARCRLSSDPLSSSLDGQGLLGGAIAVDSHDNLWFVLDTSKDNNDEADPTKQSVYVIARDGVLRRLDRQIWNGIVGLGAGADGSLLLNGRTSSRSYGAAYRIADADAAARGAAALPAVAAGCVSDNRVPLHTLKAPVTALADVPLGSVRLDTHGGYAATSNDSPRLVRYTAAGTRTVYRSTLALHGLTADGAGGAWWYETSEIGAIGIGHLLADGTAKVVYRSGAATLADGDALTLAPDPTNGSVWWSDGDSVWRRTAAAGRTTMTAYSGGDLVLGGGTGFAFQGQPDGHTVPILSVSRAGDTHVVLGSPTGRDLSLPSALAARVTSRDYSTYGSLAATPTGALLLLQDGVLARFDGTTPTVLAGPADGLPRDGELAVIGTTAIITRGVHSVGVPLS